MIARRKTTKRQSFPYFAGVFVLMVCLLSPLNSRAQSSSDESPVFSIQTELLLEVLLDGVSLDITVLAYQREGEIYVALGELMDAIRFPINTDAKTGRAGGWFIEEEREFLLDLNQGVALSDQQRFSLTDQALVFQNQIFVTQGAVEAWFPLSLEPLIRQLALNVNPREPIPLQESLRRRSNRVFGAGAVNREPELPFQETPYKPLGRHSSDLRVNTSSVLNDEDDTSTSLQGSYSLLSRGDLAWMTSTIALSGNDQDDVSNGRIKLERDLNRPFLNLDYVELGDVDAGSRGVLVRGGGAERGTQGTFSSESIDLIGDIPPDWEVELYRNGILIDVQTVGSDAQYEFLEVPLEFGENRFEFIFYGPFGEERRDERIVFAGDGLDFGEVSYTLSAVEDGESVIEGFQANQKGTQGTGRYQASFNVGLGARTTGRLSVDSFELEGERLEDASLGVSTSFSNYQTNLGYNRRERSLDSATGLIRGRFGEDSRGSFRYTEFITGDLPADLIPENRSLRTVGLGLSSRIFDNPFAIDASHTEREIGGNTFVNLGTTIPTPWVRLSKSFFYQRLESETGVEEQSGGSFNFSYDHDPWRFRSGGSYNISPESEMSSVFASANIQLERRMSMNFDVRHRPQDDYTNYRMGFSWGLDYLQISPQVIYDSNERWVGLVSLSTSFNPRPDRYVPAIDRLSQAGFGAAHARAFLDDDGDGVWDDGEEGLEGVRVDAIQSYRTATTAADGNGYLTRLRDNRVTDIAIDPSSLPGFDLNSTTPGVSIRPRPGSWSTVDFPIIRTMELEGYVFEARSEGQEPAPAQRLLVRLVDQDGELVSQQRTVFDGFYLFSNVPPGTYDIELREEYEDRLIERPGQVVVTSAGGVIRNLDFLIARETRSLASPLTLDDGNTDAPSTRIIAPQGPEDAVVESVDLPEEAATESIESAEPERSLIPEASAETPDVTPVQTTAPVENAESVVAAAAPAKAEPEEPASTGNWHVQFGAFSQEANARRRWEQLSQSEVLPDSQSARYQATGELVRLLTDVGLAEDDARALCDQVKSAGLGDCLVRQIDN